ncbi:branched-chain amino acid ABC transporter permease [Longispora sp. NPDC051575]|uniref:branched-chain amino acid ABC transporter permease n=1 Tax=Longispora sp. NPDC051575 TaxID=3154943 RepID=UPI00342C3B9F
MGSGAFRGAVPRRTVAALGVAGMLAVPWILGPYPVLMLSHALILGLLAMSANLLTGVTGLPTLGQAAYLGVGGYAAATVARAVTPVGVVQLLAAVVAATAAALLTGTVVARSHGIVAIMVTLAVGELLHEAAVRWTPVTGGTDGLAGIGDVVPFWGLPPLPLDGQVYYYVLAVFAVLAAAVAALVRSPVGLVLRGIRDHAARMRAHGYPVFRYRLLAQCVAGGLAGAAGALTVSAQRYFSPADLGFDVSALALLAVVIGGTGSLWGACAGAAVLVVLRDQGLLGAHNGLLLGATCLLAVYALPGGLAALPRRLANLRRPRT